jgi:hypothetical protein
MTEACTICGCEVALLHPVSLLQLIAAVGVEAAEDWRECYLCKTWTRSWELVAA